MTERTRLPDRRTTETFTLVHADKTYTVSVGYFVVNTLMHDKVLNGPAEVFISGTKAGSDVEAVARDGAVLLSIALQYGVPLTIIQGAITRGRSDEPMTIVGAVVDLLAREAR
jgi:hypothetical protein